MVLGDNDGTTVTIVEFKQPSRGDYSFGKVKSDLEERQQNEGPSPRRTGRSSHFVEWFAASRSLLPIRHHRWSKS
jgi:hypothetical protein